MITRTPALTTVVVDDISVTVSTNDELVDTNGRGLILTVGAGLSIAPRLRFVAGPELDVSMFMFKPMLLADVLMATMFVNC